ncbi:protein-L-isoaspartate(D-aspartate) O-methyltransferase [Limibacterium fermenti]|uniref:protein-L-isoaspartate(D-aspartate) O-methyltransferase n=1 Tax=Limibacterium fermenti TaxID=3229863 RepID=UPI003A657731
MTTIIQQISLSFIIAVSCAGIIGCAANGNKKSSSKTEIAMTDTIVYADDRAKKLVEKLRRKGITDERVLAAIGTIPRQVFIDKSLVDYAYADRALPIDKGQTISQPYTVAFQTQLLQLRPGDKVLEIGTGSGYQAAVLCEMGMNVYSIERYEALHRKAEKTLESLNYYPKLFFGDGYEGLPDHAPFDKILITAAPEQRPEKLLHQLRIGGLMVVPVGDSRGQKMMVIERTGPDSFEESEEGRFIFVPMKEGTEEN